MRGPKIDVEKQERVVTALWKFAGANQRETHPNCESGDGTRLHTRHVETALGEIMAAFGYNVAQIQ